MNGSRNYFFVNLLLFVFIILMAGIGAYLIFNGFFKDIELKAGEQEIVEEIRQKVEPVYSKGIYLTAYTAGDYSRFDYIIEKMKDTDLNTAIIDIKDYSGEIAYDSQVPLVKELGLAVVKIDDIKSIVSRLKKNNIYPIARISVFQDPLLTEKKPEWAIKNRNTGAIWKDYKGLGWLDPANEQVWDFYVDLAKEAIALGFDEVNFDYVRFPSDGDMLLMSFPYWDEITPKNEIIKNFFAYLHQNLKNEPAYLSVDLFGLTTIRTDDMFIGQVIEDAGPFVDYICPMVYPSHYPNGYNNFANPADHPYEIIYEAVDTANFRLNQVIRNKAKLRPWLQDFDLGAEYDSYMINEEIKAVEDGKGAGWLMWNSRNEYTWEAY